MPVTRTDVSGHRFSLAIGNHFVAADHGDRSRAQVLRRATARLLG
jgi:hypothetical protein